MDAQSMIERPTLNNMDIINFIDVTQRATIH